MSYNYTMFTSTQPVRLLDRNIDRIRIAVAGLGKMGSFHTMAIRQLAAGEFEPYYKAGLPAQTCKLELCGLCDPVVERGKSAAADTTVFQNWPELLEELRPDLAVIASPTSTHFELTKLSLAAGVHTLVEKPLVTSTAEFRQLKNLATEKGCRLMSGHVERYNPVAIKIRALLAGEPKRQYNYHFQRTQKHDPRITDNIVSDKIIHDLDLAQYFFGIVHDVELLDFRKIDDLVQEAKVFLRHENGNEGTLFVSWLQSDLHPCRKVSISCSNGDLLIGDFAGKQLTFNGNRVSCSVPDWIKPNNNQIKDEMADFVAYCMVPDPTLPRFEPLLQLDEIKRSVEIIETLIMQAG